MGKTFEEIVEEGIKQSKLSRSFSAQEGEIEKYARDCFAIGYNAGTKSGLTCSMEGKHQELIEAGKREAIAKIVEMLEAYYKTLKIDPEDKGRDKVYKDTGIMEGTAIVIQKIKEMK